MITAADFAAIVERLGSVAADDISWANGCAPPTDADEFALEIIFVICNSGMRHAVAAQIYRKVRGELLEGGSAAAVFGHKGKAAAIDTVWRERRRLLNCYLAADDKVMWAETLPWIGKITAYHVAKNFGAQVAKPDVHLRRLADIEKTTPQMLCERLARETGHKVVVIDTVLWRACATGLMNSKTGKIVNG